MVQVDVITATAAVSDNGQESVRTEAADLAGL